MPKYRSIKERGNQANSDKFYNQNQFLFFNFISIILVIIGISGLAYITIKYLGRDPYANYSLFALILGLSALFGLFLLNPELFSKGQNKYLNSENILFYGLIILSLVFLIALTWALTRITLRYALTAQDLYFYYISIAIIEELFFRMFLMGLIKSKTRIHNVLSAFICSFAFMMAHYEYYGASLSDMIAVYLAGVILGLYYVYTEDISITMIGHMLINLYAVGNVIISVGG